MTIGWGYIGTAWTMPVLEVMVRQSRYTKELLDSSNRFTVTVPFDDELNKALAYCGKNSGRDVDKIKECGLVLLDGREIDTPVVKCSAAQFECEVIFTQEMDPSRLDSSIQDGCYANRDYHTMYYGKIVDAYVTDSGK